METSVPLFVARSNVRQAEWRCLSLLSELHAGWGARGPDSGSAASSDLEFGCHGEHAASACHRPGRRGGYLFALLHYHSKRRAGYGKPSPARPHRTPVAAAGGANGILVETTR